MDEQKFREAVVENLAVIAWIIAISMGAICGMLLWINSSIQKSRHSCSFPDTIGIGIIDGYGNKTRGPIKVEIVPVEEKK